MKIDYKQIDKELSPLSLFNRITANFSSKCYFRLMSKLSRREKVPLPENIDCSNIWIDREDGTKMRMRVYKPLKMEKKGPAILWIHGGGYALCTPENGAPRCKRLIDESGAVIISPDYTLSVEKPYPAALDDCYLALKWLAANAEELGARSDQIIVAGESAGGGMTAAIALYARDKKEVNIAFHMPLYPMIDDRPTESSRENDAPIWNARKNRTAWKLYLGSLYGTENVPIYAAPARTTDFSGLPPAVTFVGDLDPFYSENTEYFDKMQKAGVDATCRVYKGCYHGFDVLFPETEISKKSMEESIETFNHAVETYFRAQP